MTSSAVNGMAKASRQLLVQEVHELTAMLRDEPILEDLRSLLKRKRLVPDTCLLAGFMESENGKEWGVLVVPGGRAIEYERRVAIGKQRPPLIHWRELEDAAELAADRLPALLVGIELARRTKW